MGSCDIALQCGCYSTHDMKAAGRIVVKHVPTGSTSVVQVCDLIGNKTLKQFTRSEHYSWRAKKISEERARNNN